MNKMSGNPHRHHLATQLLYSTDPLSGLFFSLFFILILILTVPRLAMAQQATASLPPLSTTENIKTTSTTPTNTSTRTTTAPKAPTTATHSTTTYSTTQVPKNVIDLAKTVAFMAFNYNYNNYQENFATLSGYFTPTGWHSFATAMNKSRNLEAVVNAKLTATAKITGNTTLIQRGRSQGQPSWTIQVPVNVVYTDPNNKTLTHNLLVRVVITQMPTKVNRHGMAVTQFIALPNRKTAPKTTNAAQT